MNTYWIPGVNNLANYGRWAFAQFGDLFQMEADFEAKLAQTFDSMIATAIAPATAPATAPAPAAATTSTENNNSLEVA